MSAINAFVNLVRENASPGMVVVEVGVGRGDTSLAWLPIVREQGSRGILIDHFKGNLGELQAERMTYPWIPEAADRRAGEVADRIIAAALDDVTEIWQASSRRAAHEMPDASIDIVFIDADHRRSAVRQDILLWLPKVRAGGILCGHDVHSLSDAADLPDETWEVDVPTGGPYKGRHCGVDRAVWEAFGTLPKIHADNVWVWRVR